MYVYSQKNSSVVHLEFEPWLGHDQSKEYKIGICCFSAKQAALRWSKDWLAQNRG